VTAAAPNDQLLHLADAAASVDYMACCGAGHRLSKMSEANYLAKRMGFSLRTFWRYCNDDEKNIQTEVFQYVKLQRVCWMDF
jgi:hypothetical protein